MTISVQAHMSRSASTMSPLRNRSQSVRSSPNSLCPLPAYRQMPSPTTAPQASENTAAIRASGNPRPGFCATGCGYAAWFAGVSGMVTEDPS